MCRGGGSDGRLSWCCGQGLLKLLLPLPPLSPFSSLPHPFCPPVAMLVEMASALAAAVACWHAQLAEAMAELAACATAVATAVAVRGQESSVRQGQGGA